MNSEVVTQVGIDALTIALKVSLPFLMTALIVGLLVSIFQAMTQIQEMTLAFIPKIIVVGLVMMVAGPWMLDELTAYTRQLFLSIPQLAAP